MSYDDVIVGRGLGGLRAGEPAERGPGVAGARARGGADGRRIYHARGPATSPLFTVFFEAVQQAATS
jgi:hypothetical protein